MLILDEPTSGVDPVARDSFWELLIDLSRKQGVTIFVTTHFMNEGMRCDRISLMNAGKVLACDAPQKLIEARGAASLEDAFIGYMEDAIADAAPGGESKDKASAARRGRRQPARRQRRRSNPASQLRLGRMLAYSAQRDHADPARSGATGLRLRRFGAADAGLRLWHHHRRRAHSLRHVRSRSVAGKPRLSRAVRRIAALLHRNPAGPLRRGRPASDCNRTTSRWSSRFRRTSAGISAGAPGRRSWRRWTAPTRSAARPSRSMSKGSTTRCCAIPRADCRSGPQKYTANIQDRYMYNPTFESIYSIVPSVPALLLILIPAILMTVSIVREKELGSIINFYVTPTGRLEYLLGKQLPYIAIGMINFFILVAMATDRLRRPDQGQLPDVDALHAALRHGDDRHRHGDLDLHQQPGRGRLRHRDSHHCADHPVLRLAAAGLDARGQRRVHRFDLADDLLHALELGAYTKGLGPDLMMQDIVFLACCIPVLWAVSMIGSEEAGEIAMKSLLNIFWLGLKELRSLASDRGDDPVRRLRVHGGDLHPGDRHLERGQQRLDRLRRRGSVRPCPRSCSTPSIRRAFKCPRLISASEVEDAMDEGRFMFVVVIPPRFEADLRAGRNPDIQVNIDATAMQQAGIGAGYIKNIINDRVASFLQPHGRRTPPAHQSGRSQAVQSERRDPPGSRASWPSSIRSRC